MRRTVALTSLLLLLTAGAPLRLQTAAAPAHRVAAWYGIPFEQTGFSRCYWPTNYDQTPANLSALRPNSKTYEAALDRVARSAGSSSILSLR